MCIAQEVHSQIFKTHDILPVCATCSGNAAALTLAALPFSAAALQFNNRLASMDKLSAAGWTFPISFRVFTSALCQRFLRLCCGRLTANSLVQGNRFFDLLVQSVNWISILQGNSRLIWHSPRMNAKKIQKSTHPPTNCFGILCHISVLLRPTHGQGTAERLGGPRTKCKVR